MKLSSIGFLWRLHFFFASLSSREKGLGMSLATWLQCVGRSAELTVKAITRFAAVHVPMH
jgi:hypothetical protein